MVVLIGVLAKTKNYAIAGLVPLFPDLCAYRPLYCRQLNGGSKRLRATIVFGMWSIHSLFYLPAVAVVFHRDSCACPWRWAGAVGCWGLSAWMLILCWSRFH